MQRARILVIVVLALVVVAGGAVFAVLRGKDDGSPAEQSAFCWGTLGRKDVSALSVRPLKRYASDEGALKDGIRADCQVGAGLDSHGVMSQLEFRLTVAGAASGSDVWRTADDVAGVSDFRGPIPGVPGWVNKSMAGVVLPLSCSSKLRVDIPAYVFLKAESDQGETWRDGTLQKRMTDVLMKAATGLTRQLGCSEPSFKGPGQAPRLIQERTVETGKACGLPGFTAPAKATKEHVTRGDFRLWSCSLGSGADAMHFTITQDPYLLALHDLAITSDPDSTLLTCEGKKTLVQDDSGDRELERAFRAAVARRGNCS